MTGGILQSAAGFPLYQRNSIPRRAGVSTPPIRQGSPQAQGSVRVNTSVSAPPLNRTQGSSAVGNTGDWRTSMPGMPALSGGEIGTGSMSGRTNPFAWQQSGAEETQQEEAAAPLLPGQEEEEEPENLMEPEKCETCENRKYQDGSTDPGVSFKTPGKINPDAAASVVRSHEMEHVFHEQAQARQDGREIVSQSVSLHTGICPECGRVYISGGTTRTVTRSEAEDLFRVGVPGIRKDGRGLFAAA